MPLQSGTPQGTLSMQGPSRVRAVFSAFLVPTLGWFPELTPVRSQAMGLWLSTLEAGDMNHTRIVYKKLQSNKQMNGTQKEFPK